LEALKAVTVSLQIYGIKFQTTRRHIPEGSTFHNLRKLPTGATAVLVLQDGRQRNSHPIQVVFRDFLGTEMKMYHVAIARVE